MEMILIYGIMLSNIGSVSTETSRSIGAAGMNIPIKLYRMQTSNVVNIPTDTSYAQAY